jgi:C4-dicarboxylate transporter DctM subunit
MEIVKFAVLIGPLFGFIAMGVPIFLSMGLACVIFTLIYKIPIFLMAMSYIRGIDSFAYLAIPFYFLAGDLMNQSGITERLLRFSSALVGHIKGGLSHVNVIASMVFSGVSGSSVADAAAVGSVLIPAMKKAGYHGAYAAAITAAASTMGPIIPPSIPFVMFGLLASTSIGDLFLAGIVPGVLMGIFLLISSYFISRKRNYPSSARASLRTLVKSFLDAFLALLMPIIIVAGITTGIVTPTESGVVAVVYAILIGLFVYKGFTIRELPRILKDSMLNSGLIIIIIATTGLFAYLVADMRAGELLVKFFTALSSDKWVILTVIVIFFLIWGCVLDPITALVVLVPLLVPVANAVGIDTIHFGVVIVLTLMIGNFTPPVGIVLYLTAAMANSRIEDVVKESGWFLLALLSVLAICMYLEGVVLWLPRYFSG